MLSIKPIGSSDKEVGYYASLGKEDYYLKGTEPPGIWWGSGARCLELSGTTVTAETFRNLLLGVSPDGKTHIVQNAKRKERRAAFDLTWSVPKSVSVAWSQADFPMRKQIEEAGERAVVKVMECLEEFCGVTRRGKEGKQKETGGLVGSIFRHETSRGTTGEIPDPNLHWHSVVCNVSVREDGTTGAWDARPLFRPHMKMALGALFRAELSKEMEALGLTSHRPQKENGQKASWFELDVVPSGLCQEFSKRRRAIKEWLDANGLTGAKASEKAALATRNQKEEILRDDLFAAWREVGLEFGFEMPFVFPLFQEAASQNNREEAMAAATTDAIARITNERAHFSELELLRFAAEESQGRFLGIDAIRQGVSETLSASPEIVRLREIESERHFTTQEMLQIEKEMLECAMRQSAGNEHRLTAEIVSAAIENHLTLRAEQREAVRSLTLESDIACINGMAGTGKTYLLSVAKEAWEEAGKTVVGTALAAKAAKTLEDGSGIESRHIHSLLFGISKGERILTPQTVLVVDEAGMVGTRLMGKVLLAAEDAHAKVVLVGDHRQLQAIDAGSPFRGIAVRVGVLELTEITRQRERWAREAVKDLAFGNADTALKRFSDRGLVVVAQTKDEAMDRLVTDWHRSSTQLGSSLIFAQTRLEAAMLNRLCQDLRLLSGDLAPQSIELETCRLHPGDRVLFTRNKPSLLIRNGSMGRVARIIENGIRVCLDDGYTVDIDLAAYKEISLGYAVTTHKGQGQTVDTAFVLAGGTMTDREISYVQGSRARGDTKFYTDAVSAGEDLTDLARKMARSRQKDLAHDYLLEAP